MIIDYFPTRGLQAMIRAVSLAVLSLVVATGCGSSSASETPTTAPDYEASGVVHRFVIPDGTGALLDRGETVDLMPSLLEIKVGDAVEIVNEDERDHNVGFFYVRSGETVSQVFPSVAQFSDFCAVSESGEFTINVT